MADFCALIDEAIDRECRAVKKGYFTVRTKIEEVERLRAAGSIAEAELRMVEACDAEWDLTGDCKVTQRVGESLWGEAWSEVHDRVFEARESERG